MHMHGLTFFLTGMHDLTLSRRASLSALSHDSYAQFVILEKTADDVKEKLLTYYDNRLTSC
jgi:hypothetical protein